MRTFVVVVAAPARRDLLEIAEWIARAESRTVALAYVARIEAFCEGLDVFPHRGTLLANGVRRSGFEAVHPPLRRPWRSRASPAGAVRRSHG